MDAARPKKASTEKKNQDARIKGRPPARANQLETLNDPESSTSPTGGGTGSGSEHAKLKSATLGRVSRMFKQRPEATEKTADPDNEECTRKEKTNSLGRMLKLVDKDGSPRKLFGRARAGSLTRILRRQSNHENDQQQRPDDDPSAGIISRMLNQLRGRSASGNPRRGEPSGRKTGGKTSSLPPKPAPQTPTPASTPPPSARNAGNLSATSSSVATQP